MKKTFLSILFFISFSAWAQHNGSYIHYMFNGILFNPAYAGVHEALNTTALYRNQWSGIKGAPVTLSFGAHTPLKNNRLNVGVVIENERYAIFQKTKAMFSYAYRIRFLNGKLSFGLQAGVNAVRADWSKINTHDIADPNFGQGVINSIMPAAGAGLYYHSRKFYFGYSIPELYSNRSVSYHTMIVNSGWLLKISDDFHIKPSVLLKGIPGSPYAANASVTFYYRDLLGLGGGYTHLASWMTYIDIRLNDQLNFGYGFERPTGKINQYVMGSHEIMLRYLFRYRIAAVNARYF